MDYQLFFIWWYFFFLLFNKNVGDLLFSPDRPEIIEEIIRVDVVGLPRLTQQELKQLENAFEQSNKDQETESERIDAVENKVNESRGESNKVEEEKS